MKLTIVPAGTVVALLLFPLLISAQQLDKLGWGSRPNLDSLFHVLLQKQKPEWQGWLQHQYDSADEKMKEFVLIMADETHSSKRELIANIDTNYDKINKLKTEYLKIIPRDFDVEIDLNPPDILLRMPETIDLKIYPKDKDKGSVNQDWNLLPNSHRLDSMLTQLHWNYQTLANIKEWLTAAHCVSIESGDVTTIGFARSGMGKYFYKIFDKDLTPDQKKEYDDGRTYIYYKKNIVLQYGGGAIGPQSFPD
jgi:hypothetical protein